MATSKAIDRLKLKLPPGRQLPSELNFIVSNRLPLSIAWSSLKPYGLKKAAELELIPVIHVADGSLVALWYATDPPAIVFVGAHGESPRVIAKDFSNFLQSISTSKTGVPAIDEDCADTSVPGFTVSPSRSGIPTLQKKLDAWTKKNSSLQQPRCGSDTESLRKRIHRTVKLMIRDGLSQVYGSRDYWSMHFRVKRVRTAIQIQYLDYGKWYAVPADYDFESMTADLLELMKEPKARRCELTVTRDGIVSIDDDRQLVLVPPL